MKDAVDEISEPKTILMSANALLTLKSNLETYIGAYKTKGFLFRLGKEFGIEAAKNKEKELTSNRKIGKMHTRLGHVQDVTFKGEIIRHRDGTVECRNARGKWINSFEAEIFYKRGEVAKEPVCHTLCGFASGALSYEFGASIIAIETKCVAKGDSCCEYEIRLEKDWLLEEEELIKLYQNDNIISELEMTYDALLHHKQLLEKLSVFQTELTMNVTEKYSMKELIDEAYRLLQIPIVVEDRYGNHIEQSGFDQAQLEHIWNNPPLLFDKKDNVNVLYYEGEGYMKLAMPVLIKKKDYATCSLIYFPEVRMGENDYLFLEKISNVVALSILYEEAQFEEEQRMRNSIIERLMSGRNLKIVESSLKFLPFDFKAPYTTAVLEIESAKTNSNLIDYPEQIIQLSKLFEVWNLPSIFAIIGDEIILWNSNIKEPNEFNSICEKLLKKMKEQNPEYVYTLGVSDTYKDFSCFKQSLEEARVAQRFPNKKLLTEYSELGMLGDMVTGMKVEQIHRIAKKTLKDLYDFEDKRKKELLYTLYIYLINGGHLKATMEHLHLSIGGIQYRIRKIEELLQNSLDDATNLAYILLSIQALVLVGTLEFD